jgi:hypothetical protein
MGANAPFHVITKQILSVSFVLVIIEIIWKVINLFNHGRLDVQIIHITGNRSDWHHIVSACILGCRSSGADHCTRLSDRVNVIIV